MYNALLYIDPGNGSYLIQAIIAAVLGVSFYFKRILFRIRSFFSRGKKQHDTKDDVNDNIEN